MELYEIVEVRRPKQASQPFAYRIKEKAGGARVRWITGIRAMASSDDAVENEDKVTVRFKVDRILNRFTRNRQAFLLMGRFSCVQYHGRTRG